MIILDLKLNNILQFNDFHINFTYPRKLSDSTIEDEHLLGFNNFRYKKINLIFGTNATGKTSLGMSIMGIFNFILRKSVDKIAELIIDKSKTSGFVMDFIPSGDELYRLRVDIPIIDSSFDYSLDSILIEIQHEKIWLSDSYEICSKRLSNRSKTSDLGIIPKFGWRFSYPVKDGEKSLTIETTNDEYLKMLENVLKTLDNSIIEIEEVEGVEDSYAIKTCNNKIIIQNSKVVDETMLSSGTKDGIDIANFLYAIVKQNNGFYYLDEKFSYIHSDIEKSLINIMLENLGYNQQLFITTHNLDVATMDLPKHTFTFMRKKMSGCDVIIDCICASDKLKKTCESIKNAIENDVFVSQPNLEYLSEYM